MNPQNCRLALTSLFIYTLSIAPALYITHAMQIRRTWTTKHWCQSVIETEWPFAYSKYASQTEESKGRVSTNLQDVRHTCETRGVQSKCHVCEDINCNNNNHFGGKSVSNSERRKVCHFQLQGVNWNDMSRNIPTLSDVPWAVGSSSHRYDFGGTDTTHVCLYMTSTYPCQSSFGSDYSNCPLRCWGHNSNSTNLDRRNVNIAGSSSAVNEDDNPTGIWPNVDLDSWRGVNATPWTLPSPTSSWSYLKSGLNTIRSDDAVMFQKPLDSDLPQGFTFTLAGSEEGQAGFQDGSRSDSRFHHPEGLAVDQDGYVYVADSQNHAIRMISPSGKVTTLAGTGKPGNKNGPVTEGAEFDSPSGIAVWRDWQWWPYPDPIDPDSFLYRNGNGTMVLFVADTGNHRIRRITGKVEYSGDNYNDEKVWSNVTVECFSGNCNNYENQSPQAGFADGKCNEARYDSPRGVTVNNNGDVFVADSNNHLIRVIDRKGVAKTLAGSLVLAETNHLNDPLEGCPNPCLAGVPGHEDGELKNSKFSFPSDVAVGVGEDHLLVTDRHHLRRIDLIKGRVETLAGGLREGESDGESNEAFFNKPESVTITSDGFGYIVDSASCRIRRASSPSLIAPNISCSDTLASLFRPSGCSSYNDAMDDFGMKVTPVSGNTYYNYEYRELFDRELGAHYVGRGIKDCVGSAPRNRLDKKLWNDTLDVYPYNLNLVIDDHNTHIREDPNDGSLMKVFCPRLCSSSDYIYGLRLENTSHSSDVAPYLYSEESSVCIAAFHAGVLTPEEGGLVDIILRQANTKVSYSKFKYSFEEGEFNFDGNMGQLYSIRLAAPELWVQTISGAPSTLLENSCGYQDSIPPQEAKFGTPVGLAAFVNKSLDNENHFLYIADRNNNVIRVISATCSYPCENGARCIGPDQCLCEPGWEGVDCTRPICSNQCGKRQLCVAPDTCACIPGYKGEDCLEAMCVQECENRGFCSAPDTCSCQPGWFDSNCTTPVCEQTCGNGGNCTAPNTCNCPEDWTGIDCRIPVCEQYCVNGGICVAPNTCSCPPHWSGFDCSAPVCHQGYFVPHDVTSDDNIPTHWTEYRPCNITKWCEETNSFDCSQKDKDFSSVVPLYGDEWRYKSGHKSKPPSCFLIEIGLNASTAFQYLNSWDNKTTPHRRHSQVTPYNWNSLFGLPWNAQTQPTDNFTQPWSYSLDRQVALVELYNVTQGTYVCANSGKCTDSETCSCANNGWMGFDCRVPICEQGYYEPSQEFFVKGTNKKNELLFFESFLSEKQTYRLDPVGDGYSNPPYDLVVERYINQSFVERIRVKIDSKRYLKNNGDYQGGYSCSIRSVTQWEDYRSEYLFEHPNYYSRYMDKKVEADGNIYTFWEGMEWEPTYQKSQKLELHDDDILPDKGSNRLYLYTDQGYKRDGDWTRTGSLWTKGTCIVEFKRVCEDEDKAYDLEAGPNGGLNIARQGLLVQDTDISFRPRVAYDDAKEYLIGEWRIEGGECVDHVVRGCFNNGTCIGPNLCRCEDGWTSADCSVPTCSQECLHNGNCTHPDTCTCEKGWTGHDCSVPVCAQECNNGGECIAPDTCKCLQWENTWRDGRIGGGVPLFQTPEGSPQMTGWTGYDCSTPICVQAETFRFNVDMKSYRWDELVPLGGHGKDGKLDCDNARCPEYEEMVIMNDGRSFQTGCGFDPLITGCCYESKDSLFSPTFTCFKCHEDELKITNHSAVCSTDASDVQSWDFGTIEDIPFTFKHSGGMVRQCGAHHNPGGPDYNQYFVSVEPNARSEQSNRNFLSNTTSDHFLCQRHEWEQGDYVDDASLGNEAGIGADFGLQHGRHVRINYNNYQRSGDNPYVWKVGQKLPGEGIFQCYNFGSCIGPDVCTCRDGYTGFDCSTPVCRHRQTNGVVVGCLNGGSCQDKDSCHCIQTESVLWMVHKHADRGLTGWTGSDCSTPICVQGYYDPTCEGPYAMGGEGCYRCANGGTCVAPDICSCQPGWTGFDCTTPICEARLDPAIRKELMTVDEEKIHIFETDPCGLKGFYKPELWEGVEYYRGNCTLPNQCTCFCKGYFHSQLCNAEGGGSKSRHCRSPFHDPLYQFRNVLAPNELFGSRSCHSGYEGIVNETTDAFMSCHMTIYEPDDFTRNSVSILFWSTVCLLIFVSFFIYNKRRLHKRYMLKKIERRRSRRSSVVPSGHSNGSGDIAKPRRNSLQYASIRDGDDLFKEL